MMAEAEVSELLVRAQPLSVYRSTLKALDEVAVYSRLDGAGLLAQAMRDAFADCQSDRGMARLRKYRRALDEAIKKGEVVTEGSEPTSLYWSNAEWRALQKFVEESGEMYVTIADYAVQEFLYQKWMKLAKGGGQ